jgi:hypothetical protein
LSELVKCKILKSIIPLKSPIRLDISDPIAGFQRLCSDISDPLPYPRLTQSIWLSSRVSEVFSDMSNS